MSVPVAGVVAVAALALLALATLEVVNPAWRYSRDRGPYVERGLHRSRFALALGLVILVLFGAAPQLLLILAALDPSQPVGSRVIGAGETVAAAAWIGLLGWRAARARHG